MPRRYVFEDSDLPDSSPARQPFTIDVDNPCRVWIPPCGETDFILLPEPLLTAKEVEGDCWMLTSARWVYRLMRYPQWTLVRVAPAGNAVEDDGQMTYLGIDRSAYPFWNSKAPVNTDKIDGLKEMFRQLADEVNQKEAASREEERKEYTQKLIERDKSRLQQLLEADRRYKASKPGLDAKTFDSILKYVYEPVVREALGPYDDQFYLQQNALAVGKAQFEPPTAEELAEILRKPPDQRVKALYDRVKFTSALPKR